LSAARGVAGVAAFASRAPREKRLSALVVFLCAASGRFTRVSLLLKFNRTNKNESNYFYKSGAMSNRFRWNVSCVPLSLANRSLRLAIRSPSALAMEKGLRSAARK
jgi:hypothetical protein